MRLHCWAKAPLLMLIIYILPFANEVCGDFIAAYDDENNVNKSFASNQTYMANDGDAEERPSEVQKAICTVTAGEVRASAEAVTTKTLKGVCGSAELQTAFRELETKLYRELAEIKALLLQQQMTHDAHNNNNFIQIQQTIRPAAGGSSDSTTTTSTTPSPPPTSSAASKKQMPKLKSLPSDSGIRPSFSIAPRREQEVNKFNNTLLTDRELKIFTYYWKLENFSIHLQGNDDQINSVESPIFAIKGKTLHIKAHFHHLRRDLLYLQLEETQLHSNNRHNIVLDTNAGASSTSGGALFKAIISDTIVFKHKISLLDQQQQHGKDLVSQELNKLETGFLIPHSALVASPYVKDDALLIQIFLYL